MKTTVQILVLALLMAFGTRSFAQCCTASAGPNKTYCCTCVTIGGSPSATYTCGGHCAAVLYSWRPTTGLNNPNIANPCASPSQTTTYTLTIYVIDTVNHDTCCTSSSTVKVTKTISCCRMANPNPASATLADEHINLFPNPTTQAFTVEIDHDLTNGSVEVYDVNGKLIWQKRDLTGSGKQAVDLAEYPKGMYFVRVKDQGEEIFSKKVLLQ